LNKETDNREACARTRSEPAALPPWRDQLFSTILLSAMILGFVVYPPSLLMAIHQNLPGIIVVDTLVYGWVIVLFFLRRRLSYRFRALSLCLLAYILGVTLLMTVGPISQIYLFGFSVVTGILLGTRMGLAALALNAITLFVLGYGDLLPATMNVSQFEERFTEWLVISANFILVNGVITLSVSVLIETLERALKRERGYSATLAADHRQLLETNRELGRQIAERKRAESRAHRLAAAIDKSVEGILITNPQGAAIYGNPAFIRLSGTLLPDTTQPELADLLALAGSVPSPADLAAMLQKNESWKSTIKACASENSPVMEMQATRFHDHEFGPDAIMVILRDVTREKALQEQLLQKRRLESLGTLAGGIAHDFNNILTAILGNAELLLMEKKSQEKVAETCQRIVAAAGRARDLVRRILTFSRQAESETQPVDLLKTVEEALVLLRSSLPATIGIRREQDAENTVIMADPAQMHQVIMNLCTNAYQAMRDSGGTLSLRLKNISTEELPLPAASAHSDGNWVQLTVEDTGHGIPDAILEKIFDPFFTTREPGEGTGLGLATVHGIVENLGGCIRVESQAGRGTAFHLYLPAVVYCEMEALEKTETAPHRGEGKHILLVDDEPAIVSVTSQILERRGYRMTTCLSGSAALAAVRETPRAFDAVITDQTMPGMTGMQLAAQIHVHNPELPVILSSGFSETASEDAAEMQNITAFLRKPYRSGELFGVLEPVLRSVPERPA
jgi:C4-dicarboxylate-specific signal transduction histidine kinase/ActR/RegA family two-component response regulator